MSDETPLTIQELADELGVSKKTIHRWVEEGGCPHDRATTQGRPLLFDKSAVVAWMTQTGHTGLMGRPPEGIKGGEEDSTDVAKIAKLTRFVNLEIKRYEAARRKRVEDIAAGTLIDRAEVERGRIERIGFVRAGLLALPGKLAPRLVGLSSTDIQRELDREVNYLLAQFAGQDDQPA